MKRGTIILIVVAAVLLLGGCSSYNGLVNKQVAVDQQWAEVQNQYQRRSDLIPNLVNTVKGAANFEKSTLEAVIQARANATRPEINVSADNLTPEKLQQFEAAQGQVTGALGRLLAVAEAYPTLQANRNFLELQAQLEGTENRITQARRGFNAAAGDYNIAVRRFPANIFAGIFGFSQRPFFQATTPGAENAPQVQF